MHVVRMVFITVSCYYTSAVRPEQLHVKKYLAHYATAIQEALDGARNPATLRCYCQFFRDEVRRSQRAGSEDVARTRRGAAAAGATRFRRVTNNATSLYCGRFPVFAPLFLQ